jgi:hypothetical protein
MQRRSEEIIEIPTSSDRKKRGESGKSDNIGPGKKRYDKKKKSGLVGQRGRLESLSVATPFFLF